MMGGSLPKFDVQISWCTSEAKTIQRRRSHFKEGVSSYKESRSWKVRA